MNKLLDLEKKFKSKLIGKNKYISLMYNFHSTLWDYSSFIKGKNINSIKISAEEVIFETKNGIMMVCQPGDKRPAPIEMLNFGGYEEKELYMIRQVLQKDSTILDIGANIGWYVLNIAKVFPDCRIIAFEPVNKVYECLKNNIARNRIKNIELYNFALSDNNGKALFYYNPRLSAASSLRKLHNCNELVKIECSVKKLDDCIGKITSRIDFIKCDVEGAEFFVIKGGLKAIEEHSPVLLLELLRKWSAKFGYHPNDVIKILNKIGYECFYISGKRLVRLKKINDKTVSTNFFFLNPIRHSGLISRLTKTRR